MFSSFHIDLNGGNDMKKMIILLSFLVIVSGSTVADSGEMKSLRGGATLPAGSNPAVGMDWQAKDASIARTFEHQPPLIPHDVDEYSISTSRNDCLDCHGEKDSDAPMPHASHYTDRDGNATKEVSSRWYFCSQCHVGQVEAEPLIKNTFQAK